MTTRTMRYRPLLMIILSCMLVPLASAKEPSTLGFAPPAEALVLFDGSNFDAWKPFSWQWINPADDQANIQWKLVDGDAMEIAFEFEGKRRKQCQKRVNNCGHTSCRFPCNS